MPRIRTIIVTKHKSDSKKTRDAARWNNFKQPKRQEVTDNPQSHTVNKPENDKETPDKIMTLEDKVLELKDKFRLQKTKNKSLKEASDTNSNQNVQRMEEIAAMNNTIDTIQSKNAELQNKVERYIKTTNKLSDDLVEIVELKKKKIEKEHLNSKENFQREHASKLQEYKKMMDDLHTKHTTEIKHLKETISKLETKTTQLTSQIKIQNENNMKTTDKYENKFKDIDAEIEHIFQNFSGDENCIMNLHSRIDDLKDKLEENGLQMNYTYPGPPPQEQPQPNEHYRNRRQYRAPRGSRGRFQ